MKYDVRTTKQFNKWFKSIKNPTYKARFIKRLDFVQSGHFGDYKQIDQSLFELRFFFADGFRIYYTLQGNTIVLLLNGGSKASQSVDIAKAKIILKELE